MANLEASIKWYKGWLRKRECEACTQADCPLHSSFNSQKDEMEAVVAGKQNIGNAANKSEDRNAELGLANLIGTQGSLLLKYSRIESKYEHNTDVVCSRRRCRLNRRRARITTVVTGYNR